MVRDKVRIRFRKTGDLRLISHHDLMRTFERLLRRAGVPFHSTSGFNPKPRLVFALSLGLGIVGADEVAELELDEELGVDEVSARLQQQAPPGLQILEVRRIDPRVTAQVRFATYRIPVPEERCPETVARAAALLAATEVMVERARPHQRRLDIRPYLHDFRLLPGTLEMELLVTPTGTARPDELLNLLGLGDLLAAGAVLERVRLELHDESTQTSPARGELELPVATESVGSGPPLTKTLKGNA